MDTKRTILIEQLLISGCVLLVVYIKACCCFDIFYWIDCINAFYL